MAASPPADVDHSACHHRIVYVVLGVSPDPTGQLLWTQAVLDDELQAYRFAERLREAGWMRVETKKHGVLTSSEEGKVPGAPQVRIRVQERTAPSA